MTYLTEHLSFCKRNLKKRRALSIILLSLAILSAFLLAPMNLRVAEAQEEPEATGPKANQVLSSEDGRVTINFHPELQRETGPYPVLRVQGQPISQDFIDNFLELYMSDLTLYPAKLITMQEELANVEDRIKELEERQKMEDESGGHEGYLAELRRLQASGLEGVEIWDPNNREDTARYDSYLDYAHKLQQEDPDHFTLAAEGKGGYSLLKVNQPKGFNYFSLTYQKTSYPVNNFCYRLDTLGITLFPYGHELSREEAEKISSLAQGDIAHYYLSNYLLPSGVESAEDFSELAQRIEESPDREFDATLTSAVPQWSREEALQKANDLVKALGLEHLQLAYQDAAMAATYRSLPSQAHDQITGKLFYDVRYLTPVWRFIYYPSVANHTFAYNIYGIADMPFLLDEDASMDKIMAPWNFESLVFSLGADGLVTLSYNSPMEVTEEISSEAQLLPEDEILSLAETMLVRREEEQMASVSSPQSKIELNVEYAKLTPYRILDQDDPLQGTIVPVWNFYGSKSLVYEGADDKLLFLHEQNPHNSFLTLNAIDGTVIDLTQGK